MMTPDAMAQWLMGLRMQIDAALTMLEYEAAPAECQHPEEMRDKSPSTMGHPRWLCKHCGYLHEESK